MQVVQVANEGSFFAKRGEKVEKPKAEDMWKGERHKTSTSIMKGVENYVSMGCGCVSMVTRYW